MRRLVRPSEATENVNTQGSAVSVELKVAFHACDPLAVVWHGRYFEYLEVARTALLASRDLDVEAIRAMGHRMYVTDANCRYLFPLRYNDDFRVTASFTRTSPLIRVAYQVHNLTAGRKSARAYTALATTDAAGNLLTETPDAILSRLPAV